MCNIHRYFTKMGIKRSLNERHKQTKIAYGNLIDTFWLPQRCLSIRRDYIGIFIQLTPLSRFFFYYIHMCYSWLFNVFISSCINLNFSRYFLSPIFSNSLICFCKSRFSHHSMNSIHPSNFWYAFSLLLRPLGFYFIIFCGNLPSSNRILMWIFGSNRDENG